MGRYISVHVDLDEFDTDDLVDELQRRNKEVPGSVSSDIRRMFDAFKVGATDRAMAIAREIAQDSTGGILL